MNVKAKAYILRSCEFLNISLFLITFLPLNKIFMCGVIKYFLQVQKVHSAKWLNVCVRVCNSPEAQSKRAWPEIQSKGIIYRQESWPAIWTPSSSTEGNKTLHSPSPDCTASHPDPKSNREKIFKEQLKKKMCFQTHYPVITLNWGLGSSRDSAGVSSVPHL